MAQRCSCSILSANCTFPRYNNSVPVRKAKPIELPELDTISPLHKLRWNMHRQGMEPAEIAKQHGVDEQVVRQSITRVEAAINSYTVEETARLQFRKLAVLDRAETNMLKEALKAETALVVDGVVIKKSVPDWATRLKAAELLTGRLSAVQPRKGIEINQAKTEQHLHVDAAHHQSGKGFEDILRKIESNQRQLPPAIPASELDIRMMTEEESEEDLNEVSDE